MIPRFPTHGRRANAWWLAATLFCTLAVALVPNPAWAKQTPTRVAPTATSVPPTSTSVPPTATSAPPTSTSVPPTATKASTATPTSVPPTATPVSGSAPTTPLAYPFTYTLSATLPVSSLPS